MIPEIFIDISGFTPPDILEPLIKMELLLNTVQYTDHELEIKQAGLYPDMTGNDIIASIRDTYIEHYIIVLSQYGILLNTEELPTLDFLYKLLFTVNQCMVGDAADAIERVGNNTEDNIATFALISAIVGGPTPASIYVNIESIDNKFMESIFKPLVEEEADENAKETLNKYLEFIGDLRTGITYDFIKRRNALPLTFEHCIKALRSDLIELDDPVLIAYELVSLAVASNLNTLEMKEVIHTAIENLFPVELAIKIHPKVDNRIEEYTRGY